MDRSIECPLCRKKIKKAKIEDASDLNSEILSLNVLCQFRNCPWVGPFKNLDDHEDSCSFSPLRTEKKILNLLPEYEKDGEHHTPMISIITKLFPLYPELTESLLRDSTYEGKEAKKKKKHDMGQKKIDDFILAPK